MGANSRAADELFAELFGAPPAAKRGKPVPPHAKRSPILGLTRLTLEYGPPAQRAELVKLLHSLRILPAEVVADLAAPVQILELTRPIGAWEELVLSLNGWQTVSVDEARDVEVDPANERPVEAPPTLSSAPTPKPRAPAPRVESPAPAPERPANTRSSPPVTPPPATTVTAVVAPPPLGAEWAPSTAPTRATVQVVVDPGPPGSRPTARPRRRSEAPKVTVQAFAGGPVMPQIDPPSSGSSKWPIALAIGAGISSLAAIFMAVHGHKAAQRRLDQLEATHARSLNELRGSVDQLQDRFRHYPTSDAETEAAVRQGVAAVRSEIEEELAKIDAEVGV